ncbi:MAG: YHYH protein [Pseudomonadota bacterium]
MLRTIIPTTLVLMAVTTSHVHAHDNEVRITRSESQICIRSNGLPDHETGTFPNSGNPHRIEEQNHRLCVPANPVAQGRSTPQRGSIGVAMNGVLIRPGTADWYDASSPRGHSRDWSSGWNLEGLGAAEMLGMDRNNAHVDHSGIYHYHGIPTGMTAQGSSSQIGWAADGFELHLADAAQTSSWKLKPGTRPTPPYGSYDGTFEQDWEHVAGSGSLDACNGGMLDGRFVYFVTETFPFYPRCLWGEASADFAGPGGRGEKQARRGAPQDRGGLLPRWLRPNPPRP